MNREWLNITPEEYHALPAYGSGAMAIYGVEKSLEFWAKCVAKIKKRPESKEMRLGRAFHAAMEDPNTWEDKVCEAASTINDRALAAEVNIQCGARKPGEKSGGPAPAIFLESNPIPLNMKLPTHRRYAEIDAERAAASGRDILKPGAKENLKQMIDSVYDNPATREIVEDKNSLNVEAACVLATEGADFKALCDLVHGDVITDFKSTRHPCMEDFIRFENKRLLNQAGHYCYVTGKDRFRFISVKNEAPYEANVFEVPDAKLRAYKFQAEKRAMNLQQLLLQSQLDDTDSQGMPLSYHGELWGTVIPFDLDLVT